MKRYFELDLLRTLAILLMVIYHTAFDLSQFYGWDIDVLRGNWRLLARATATLFLLLVGVSSAISFNSIDRRGVACNAPTKKLWMKQLRRFVRIGSVALLVTIATYIANPDTYVRFGILHLIAVSGLLLPLYARLRESSVIIGVLLILMGPYMSMYNINDGPWAQYAAPLLLSFGIRTATFRSVDYFPLIPWFGVIVVGYGVGYFVYVRRKLRMENVEWRITLPFILNSQFSILHCLVWPGRHALLVYILHQPLIIAVLWLIMGKPAF